MPVEPTVAPVLPRYGERSLPDLACSLLSSLGIDVSLPSDGRPHASTSSAGESFHCGSPSGLKLRVFTKCKP